MSISSSLGNLNDSLNNKYELALKLYHHRKFSKCLDILSNIINEIPIQDGFDQNWVPSCYKLLVTLYGMLYSEIKAGELTKSSHNILFPQYIKSSSPPDVLTKIQNGWLFDLIYDLKLGDNEECLLACFEMEIMAHVKIEAQLSHILKSRGLINSEKVLKLYLSKEVAPKQGKAAVREKLASILSLESEDVIRSWFDWVDTIKEEEEDDDDDDDIAGNMDYDYDSEYYQDEEQEQEESDDDDDDDSFVTADAAIGSGLEDEEIIRTISKTKQQTNRIIPKASSKVSKKNTPNKNPFMVKLDYLVKRFGGVIPLISVILTIIVLLNIRKFATLQTTRRIFLSIRRTLEMGFKVTYL